MNTARKLVRSDLNLRPHARESEQQLIEENPSSKGKTLVFFDKGREKFTPLWGVEEVADYLRVSTRTVESWVYRKVIPFRKVGRLIRFKPAQIEQWTLP